MTVDREVSRLGTLLPIALISSAVLSYEILLARLFAIVQWHNFAYMVISIALLGFGASGALLCLAGKAFSRRFEAAFRVNAALFSLTSVASFVVTQWLEFNPLELAWSMEQTGKLLLIYLALMVPFLFAANAIGLALMVYANAAGRVYAWDLTGAGAGAAGIVGALFYLSPESALLLPALLGAAAALMIGFKRPLAWAAISLVVVGLIIASGVLFEPSVRLRVSQFKALEQALQVAGSELMVERNSPLARLSVVENRIIPLRHAPGLSLLTTSRRTRGHQPIRGIA
jgi:membrane protein YdbS with pleckstrin-like domain